MEIPVKNRICKGIPRAGIAAAGILLFFICSCIEEFTPKITGNEHLLIVDGGITSMPGPYAVKLSFSNGIQDIIADPATGAEVFIEDRTGGSEKLSEGSPGIYKTSAGGIRGEEGKEYRIIIKLNDEQYESDWMLLKECPPVDSLYWQRERHPGINNDFDGIQIYIDTHDPFNKTRYYRWEYSEDWMFSVPVSSSWNPSFCYAHNSSAGIIIGSTEKFQTDRLVKQPVTYLDNTSTRLTFRYRIILIQHAITQEEFRYWESLEELNENLGTLFDPIPASIHGNIRKINDPDASVLGFFTCSSVRTDTLYVDASEFVQDPIYFDSPYSFCNYELIRGDNNPDIKRYLKWGWVVADTLRDGEVLVTTMVNSTFCCDCTTAGNEESPAGWSLAGKTNSY